jgi:uncharacterized protein (TIGR03437 family)
MHRNFCMPVVLLVLSTGSLFSQAVVCATSATPPVVRSEGLSERIGDIVLTCTGTPGNVLNANVTISLNTAITDRISITPPPGGGASLTGIVFTVDSGTGPQPVLTPPLLAGANTLAFDGVALAFSPEGAMVLDISGIRGNANSLPAGLPIIASVSINNAGLALNSAQLTTGTSERALYVSYTASFICAQAGSPSPATLTFNGLISAGTAFETARVTEGFGDAFQPLSGFENFHADSGERILLRYTGFPADSSIYVPDVIAGTDALQPTSAGDFGLNVSGGVYAPSVNGTLLLARVNGANINGAGGMPVYQPGAIGSGSVTLSTITQIPVGPDGSFSVAYEVVDANPSTIESATIPTFLGLAPDGNRQASITTEEVYLAPSSTVGIATTADPLPRFVAETAPPDCAIVGDCDPVPPKLTVSPASLSFTLPAGTMEQTASVAITNSGGGAMSWEAAMAYTSGSGWLSITPVKGLGNSTLGTIAIPRAMAPNTYTGTLTVDAGPVAGFVAIPVTLTVTAPPAPPAPAIGSVLSAASFLPEPVVPGSLATVMGSLFSGTTVSASFNNLPATIVFSNATQINLLVPSALAGQTAAQLVVTVDGVSSAPMSVVVAPFEPGIFSGGIVNQDGSVNSASNGAATGSIIAMWGTGLSGNGTITANIGGQNIATPYYAGPAPGLPGVQQINLVIPTGLAPGTTQVYVCGTVGGGSPVCGIPSPLTIR